MRQVFNAIFLLTALCFSLNAVADDAEATAEYDRGHQLYVDGNYREASKCFVNSCITADSPTIKANSLLAQIGAYRMCGLYYDEFNAIETLLEKYAEFADPALMERQFEIGDAFHKGRRDPAFWSLRWVPWLVGPDHTEEIYTKALKRSPYSSRAPQALIRLAHWYELEGQTAKSLDILRRMLKEHPEAKEYNFALLALGNGLLEIARCGGDGDGLMVAEAVKIFNEFLKRSPDAPEAGFARRKIAQAEDIQAYQLYQMADYYRRAKRNEVAARYLSKVIRKYPGSQSAEQAEKELVAMDKTYLPGDFAPPAKPRLMPIQAFEIPESAERELLTPAKPGNHYLISVPDLSNSLSTPKTAGDL